MKKTQKAALPDPRPLGSVIDQLETFRAIEKAADRVLKGATKPAHLLLKGPGYGRGSALAVNMAIKASEDNHLPSPRFEAFRVKFSDQLQCLLCTPEAKYSDEEKDLYQVFWPKDASEFRVDLADALVPLGWATPDGMYRQAPVTLQRNLPGIGSALLVDLRASELRRLKKRTPKGNAAPTGGNTTKAAAESKAAPDAKVGTSNGPESAESAD